MSYLNKPIRQSQLVSPWGVGAMIDFPQGESLIVCGLDAWVYPSSDVQRAEFVITEARLQRRLGVSEFRLPPDFREAKPGVVNPKFTIPTLRFPEWHFCQRCGSMEKLSLFGSQQRCSGRDFEKGTSCSSVAQTKRRFLVPLRFVAACEKGHIRDFPWLEWVHGDSPYTDECKLRFGTGSSASLAGLFIQCSCKKRRSMAGSFANGSLGRAGIDCGGQRPWLGNVKHDSTQCGYELSVLQKGGSNVFFPIIVSSIYLPLWAEDASKNVINVLEDGRLWAKIKSATIDGELDEYRCRIMAEDRDLDPVQFVDFARRKLQGENLLVEKDSTSEEEFRQDEFSALLEGRGNTESALSTRIMRAQNYPSPVREYVSNITLADQLRETSAFVGFSRVKPEDNPNQKEKINLLKLDSEIDWLPAVTVSGEGIFFTLDDDKVAAWERDEAVVDRTSKLSRNYYSAALSRGTDIQANIPPKFVLLHTLAHLLINQFSFDCGYGSSSLRERLYCNIEKPGFPMTGVLIYTASGDSEGTMGGLVRQGLRGNFENVFIRALKNALWCSSDPVCLESTGQGPGSCNFAACHGCALLPETACEKGNKLLDRVLVVGTPERPSLGFFSAYLQTYG
ncbi:MAG: DrmB family protein [Pyrinomonadaceae bacterium]